MIPIGELACRGADASRMEVTALPESARREILDRLQVHVFETRESGERYHSVSCVCAWCLFLDRGWLLDSDLGLPKLTPPYVS
jgi:hypothetical protein